jgi:cysteine desulfurase family protein (TIGR01976 family)
MAEFPIAEVRASFPALNTGENFIFFDNAAGAQVPRSVFDAVHDHLLSHNVQRGGPYAKSKQVDAAMARARESVAIFLNAYSPDEVAFGMNATSFIRLVSLAMGQSLSARREIIVTDLDHEANIATWLALERQFGASVVWWRVRDDGNLHVADLDPLLTSRTRLVACAVASNAVGTIVDVAEVALRAHAAGAEVFLDCVHYAPHGVMDVRAFGCDYLVCSGYKIFAPHMGFLWGRRESLDALPTFREEFIPNVPPAKIEVGTYVYENVAGMDAAIAYLEWLGSKTAPNGRRRGRLVAAMEAVRAYEAHLSVELIRVLQEHGATIYGITDEAQICRRVPTVSFNLPGVPANAVAAALADSGIGVRDGHMYSPRLMQRLSTSAIVRASLVHYNDRPEIERFAQALGLIANSAHATNVREDRGRRDDR